MEEVKIKHSVGKSCNDCRYRMLDGLSPYCMLFKHRDIEDSYKECLEERS